MLEMRHCRACRRSIPAADFYPSVKARCRECCKKAAAPGREKKLEYLAEWRSRNPDAAKRWYMENAQHKASYNAERYAKDPAKERARYDLWASANKHKVNALIAKRNARKKSATAAWADATAIEAIYAKAARITEETGVRHEVDHIVPLQGKLVCGLHWEGNLQVLTKEENQKKRNKLLEGENT